MPPRNSGDDRNKDLDLEANEDALNQLILDDDDDLGLKTATKKPKKPGAAGDDDDEEDKPEEPEEDDDEDTEDELKLLEKMATKVKKDEFGTLADMGIEEEETI